MAVTATLPQARTLAQPPLADGWKRIDRPPSLFARYEFASYRETSAFLDRLAALSNEVGIYPDLSFGNTYVNITLRGPAGADPGDSEVEFALRVATREAATTG